MHNSQSYRHNATGCLLAALNSRQPSYSKLNFAMGALWLEFARQDEKINNLLASWDMAEPIKIDGLVLAPPMPPALPQQHYQISRCSLKRLTPRGVPRSGS